MDVVPFFKLLEHHCLFSGDLKEQVWAKDSRQEKTAWFRCSLLYLYFYEQSKIK